MINKNTVLIGILSIFIIMSCSNPLSEPSRKKSSSTGWNYNDRKQGGFDVVNISEQTPGPGLIFIEGGRLTMGRVEEDVMSDWNNISKTVSVSSFYIDETEVRNVDYVEYLHWIKNYYVYADGPFFTGIDPDFGIKIYEKALPDTLVWRDKLGENEIFVNNYLRHPSYREYPVVGVSWEQANDYCIWRTDRVNERILIDAGLIMEVTHTDRENIEFPFTTDGYLHGGSDYLDLFVTDQQKSRITNRTVLKGSDEGRYTKMEDGLLLPNYRLPTEAEWEHAALAYIGNNIGDNHQQRKIYPWSFDEKNISCGNDGLRNASPGKNQGKMMANFKRGRGDNMGVSGSLNDESDITSPVISFWPNDYGLYNMAGNVSEWVADVYRPVTEQTATTDHRPFRGTVFKTHKKKDATGNYPMDSLGHIVQIEVNSSKNELRRNYKKSNNINFLDGDIESQMWTSTKDTSESSSEDKSKIDLDKRNTGKVRNTGNSNEMYDWSNTTLISDKTRVYKGGSWKDRSYWLNPGTRRFLDQSQSSDCIGFRCAMDRVGSSKSNLKQNKPREADYRKAKK